MAFVPDEAFDHADQISASAFTLYCLICRWRNHTHGNAILNLAAAQRQLGKSQSQIYRLLAELQTSGWIIRKQAFITPIFGSFAPCKKSPKISHKRETNSQICEPDSQICETHYYSNQPLNTSLNQSESNGRKPIDTEPTEKLAAILTERDPQLCPTKTEIAICETLLNRPPDAPPIFSLKYFHPEIRKWHEPEATISDDLAAHILKRRKEKLNECRPTN